jgi:hypothetical protein
MVQTAHHLLVETDRQLAVVRTMEQTGRAYYGALLLSLRLLLMLPRQRLANAFFALSPGAHVGSVLLDYRTGITGPDRRRHIYGDSHQTLVAGAGAITTSRGT